MEKQGHPVAGDRGGEPKKPQKIRNRWDHKYCEELAETPETQKRIKSYKPKFAGWKHHREAEGRRSQGNHLLPAPAHELTQLGDEHPQVLLWVAMGCSAPLKVGLEATSMERERLEGEARPWGRERRCPNWPKKKKESEGSDTLFALKTFKMRTTRATFHKSALAKTRMTSNPIKDTLSKVCFSSEELKIIFNCMKVSTQDLGDQTDVSWNQKMVLHW